MNTLTDNQKAIVLQAFDDYYEGIVEAIESALDLTEDQVRDIEDAFNVAQKILDIKG